MSDFSPFSPVLSPEATPLVQLPSPYQTGHLAADLEDEVRYPRTTVWTPSLG